jgi:hypothetical protein
MSEPSAFPSRLLECLVDDEAFALAYDATPPEQRARLKTLIAGLHALYGRRTLLAAGSESVLRHGGVVRDRSRPRSWTLLILGAGFLSPVRLLAALVPPVAVGVPDVAVAVLDGPGNPPPVLLTALELAGQEQVYRLAPGQAGELVRTLGRSGRPGAVLALDEGAAAAVPWAGLPAHPFSLAWRPAWDGRIGIWAGDGEPCDLDVLAWGHPDAALEVWGADARPDGGHATVRQGEFADFLAAGYAVAAAPPPRHEACLGAIPLVLGPGQEGTFLWPDLLPEAFLVRHVALSGGAV